jgi:transcriptional regulator with XRE-family HTH domain
MDTLSKRTRNKNNFQMETFSQRLTKAIERSGLTRPEFAAKTGVGTSALAKWLAGKLVPKSEQLLSLANTSGVTMEWLLTGQGMATFDETIDGCNAYAKSLGAPTIPEDKRDSARRLLQNRDVSVALATMEKRAVSAERKLADLKTQLEAILKKI